MNTEDRAAERDAMKDAILNGRDRREEIKAEWEALGLENRIQSPAELRRVLMTWSKAQLVEKVIRADSDAIRARHKELESWKIANEVHENTLILPDERKRYSLGFSNPFNGWLLNHKGQILDARLVFGAGWVARARSEEALSDDIVPASPVREG